MRVTARGLALGLAGLLAAGALFAWSGLLNVSASSGHWAITSWFLHAVMRQSVETHAGGIEAPDLDDPAMVLRGAGHFATGCAYCHGAPGKPPSPAVRNMTPAPPRLGGTLREWEPAELFWIVRHGIKFTGMPAWPAPERADEVWSVVAFLRALPGMAPETYRRLAHGPASAEGRADAGAALTSCARCHGFDGSGRGAGAFPVLSGQNEAYLLASLRAFASGSRASGIMETAVNALDDEALSDLARHYARQPRPERPAAPPPAAALAAEGERIFNEGLPRQRVPACASCHGRRGDAPRYPSYPRLAGQPRHYLETQLELFAAGSRGGTSFSHVMTMVAGRLEPAQIEAVAAWLASPPPQ